jgi:hypothetical protein
VLSGQVAIGTGQTVTVALPADLVKHPYVWVRGNISGAIELPHSLDAAGGTGSNPAEVNFTASIWRDKLQFFNPNGQYTLYGTYMVFNRSVGA